MSRLRLFIILYMTFTCLASVGYVCMCLPRKSYALQIIGKPVSLDSNSTLSNVFLGGRCEVWNLTLKVIFLSFHAAQFKVLMEHLDPDEEDEEGEASASANIRNKAINALLGGIGPMSGPSPRNQAGPETDDDDSDGDERTPGVRYIEIPDVCKNVLLKCGEK